MGNFLLRGNMKFFWVLAAASLAGFLAIAQINAAEKDVYIFSVVPQFTPAEINRSWTPVVEKLSRATGRRFEIKIYPGYRQFEAAFMNGEIDLAYLNPYYAVMAKRAQGYIPLLRDDANRLIGLIVVRRDSTIQSIQELNGKELAFPSPNAFATSLYPRALLADQEKISIIPRYVSTHSNVYRHVILGEAIAGGGVSHTLKRESPEVQAQLRVLYETPGVPSHPLVAHPRMPEGLRQAIKNTLIEMHNDPAEQKLLTDILMPKPVEADYARDYQPLEKLKLEKYVVIEKN